MWSQNTDLIVFGQGKNTAHCSHPVTDGFAAHVNAVRAFAGLTVATSPDTVFDTEDMNEREYLEQSEVQLGNTVLTMNWYNAFKVRTGFLMKMPGSLIASCRSLPCSALAFTMRLRSSGSRSGIHATRIQSEYR